MTSVQFYFLFPALFMLHELEEIIWMPSFVKKLSAQFPNNRILSYYTPFAFNAIVLEQFLILLLSLFLSYWFSNYTIYSTKKTTTSLPFRKLLTVLMWGVQLFTAITRVRNSCWMNSAKNSFTTSLSEMISSLPKTT